MNKSYLSYTQMVVKSLDVDKDRLRNWVNNEELIDFGVPYFSSTEGQ